MDRLAGRHEVLQDTVHGILIENAEIAVGVDIHLEGLQFHASFIGPIADADRAEVGKAGFRTDGRVLRHLDRDLIILKLIRPRLNLGKTRANATLGVSVGVPARRPGVRPSWRAVSLHTSVIHSVLPSFSRSKYITTQGHIISGKPSQ